MFVNAYKSIIPCYMAFENVKLFLVNSLFWCTTLEVTESQYFFTDTTQIGCYKKDGSRRLFTYIGDDYEPDGCVNKCKERGYSYAGLKYSNCLCGTVYPFSWSKVKTDDRECYLPCKMDPSRKCGGPYRMSIYSIY